jgi:hypothetical protein
MPSRLRRPLLVVLVGGLLAAATVDAASTPGPHGAARPTQLLQDALHESHADAAKIALDQPRASVPADRYAMAGGCYAVRSQATGAFVSRSGSGFAATAPAASSAEPFHFQAFDLGKYLLFASRSDFLAAADEPLHGGVHPASDPAEGYVRGTGDETLNPVRQPVLQAADSAVAASDQALAPADDALRGAGVVAAAKPSGLAEWVVRPLGDGFTLQMAVDDHTPEDPGPADPPIAGTLVAGTDGSLSVVKGVDTSRAAEFGFQVAGGCAAWPEIDVDVSGPYPTGPTAYGTVTGYIDAHMHGMAFEFLGGRAHCGRPWHPYGVAYALVDCPDHEPGGYGAVLEQVLSGGPSGHDTTGWPTFGYWPRYNSLTHEGTYYKWLERAWRGGLRMYTNLLVDNGVLCEIYPYKKNSCNEMDGVRLQAKRLRQLERYVDAQSGGPGKGWLRIVADPFEARRVINAGKLAVVMGIEVSVPFDCGEYLGQPRCTSEQIAQRVQEVYDLGVRQMELTNKFDNALTGVKGDNGTTGLVVNVGNRDETGHFWKMETCPADHSHNGTDNTQMNPSDSGVPARDGIFGAVLELSGSVGAVPVYPEGPHCNTIGLSDLGRVAIDQLAAHGMIFDPDHMSARARKEAMDYVASRGYSGVVSSHSWADDTTYAEVLKDGGFVTPYAGTSTSFVTMWRKLRGWADSRYLFGVGYGSDINGFGAQGGPRNPAPGTGVQYPFTGFGGVTIDRQHSGQRVYDINTDGVDHYGLYPDWIEDARLVAGADGAQFIADMQRGPEAYLEMWERTVGIAPNACRADVPDLTRADLGRLHKGMTPEEVLAEVGQPDTRQGTQFGYCSTGGRTTVTFDANGLMKTVTPA